MIQHPDSASTPSRISAAIPLLLLFGAVIFAACTATDSDSTQVESTTAPPHATATPSTSNDTAPTSSGTPTTSETPAQTQALSFANDVQPIIESTCASCHTGDGPGTQHLVLDDAGAASEVGFALAFVTETGYMPPWPASDLSVDFEHDWSLTDDQIATLQAWDDAGSPLDVPDETTLKPSNGVVGLNDDADIVIPAAGTYQGTVGQPDEYRCFIYDPQVEETSYVEAFEFIPQQAAVVHHAVGFLVSDADRASLEELDAQDTQGGWSCFGFRPGATAENVFAWAPGQQPTRFDEGVGLQLDPGDFFVMQTHYHFDTVAPADQSSLALTWSDSDDVDALAVTPYVAPAEIPCTTGETGPLCDRQAALDDAVAKYGRSGMIANAILAQCGQTAADFADMTNGIATSSCDQPVRAFGQLISVFGHEHELGSSFRMTLNPDTPDELVLLDIPDWDFDWQLNYQPVDDITLEPGDVLRIECSWDRSKRNESLEPAYVIWADGTNDEMCYSTVTTRP